MYNPIISVVTVCYNAVDVIEKTIQSVINQTYNRIEYIIIDGDSKDGTVSVINKYSGKISKKISEPDNGIYDAMNKGIDMATGEWINFMNAGDEFADEHVIYNLLDSFSNGSDVIFGNTILNNNGVKKQRKGHFNQNEFPTLGHQSTFVKTSLMKRFHFGMNYKISADFEFLYKLFMESYKFYYVDLDVAIYDVSGFSSRNRVQLYIEHCSIQKKQISKVKLLKYKIEDFLPIWLMNRIVRIANY